MNYGFEWEIEINTMDVERGQWDFHQIYDCLVDCRRHLVAGGRSQLGH